MAVVRLNLPGRSLGNLLATMAMLKERGIALLSPEEKIDTSSAAGDLIFPVFGAIAHFERLLIAERTKDGIAAARAHCERSGRQPLDQDPCRCRSETDRSQAVASRRCSPTRAGTLNRLPRGRPGRHPA